LSQLLQLNNEPISSLPIYLNYSVSYSDGKEIGVNHLLKAGKRETYKVRIEFKRDIENSELPTTEQTNTFSFGLNYLQSTSAAIAVPHPVAEIVYTANTGNTENINIGSPISNDITQYATAAEAMAALKVAFYSSSDLPFCLKHEVTDDTITASYVEFVVTSEMANNNPGMTAGTYTLQGEAMCEYDYVNDTYIGCSEEASQYYASNITTLETAFGASNCTDNTTYYSCSVSGLGAGAYSYGNVHVDVGDFYCIVNVEDGSDCRSGGTV
jgi:hypothetical protein